MSPNAIKKFQQQMNRVCPLVILDEENREVSELVMLGISEGLRVLIPLFARDSLRFRTSEERMSIYRRMIRAIASEPVTTWRETMMARQRKQAEVKARASRPTPRNVSPRRPIRRANPRPVRRR